MNNDIKIEVYDIEYLNAGTTTDYAPPKYTLTVNSRKNIVTQINNEIYNDVGVTPLSFKFNTIDAIKCVNYDKLKREYELDEARHNGQLPRHQSRRNQTDKATLYYIGVDDSDDFRGYGHYVMKDGGLTTDASNYNFRYATVTKDPEKIKQFANTIVNKYGQNKFIFIFKEEYSYGAWTNKKHARPSIVDIWYPNGQYWRYDLINI